MFLVAFTKNDIAQNFQSLKVEEYLSHSFKFTIVIDKFLSDFITETYGFSVIESPLIDTPDLENIIFSKVAYNSKIDAINISKSTFAGRPIYYHINTKVNFLFNTYNNVT